MVRVIFSALTIIGIAGLTVIGVKDYGTLLTVAAGIGTAAAAVIAFFKKGIDK